MPSVTRRIKEIKQPWGGYVPLKLFKKKVLGPGEEELLPTSLNAGRMATAIDYLTRFMLGTPANEAFKIARRGALALWKEKIEEDAIETADRYISEVIGLDDNSIDRACKLCSYDACYRAGTFYYTPAEEVHPDEGAIANIRLLVNRSLVFFEQYGPIVLDGPTFPGGYTDIVTAGDGDFLTEDTIWDMKVSVRPPTSKHTLQVLMYYLMGKHSTVKEFDSVHNIGFYNPRLNTVYTLDVRTISPGTIMEVETKVIGYSDHLDEKPVVKKAAIEEKPKQRQPLYEVVSYSVGDRVKHNSFGNGTVIEVNDKTVIVEFEELGQTKKLMNGYAPMTKISE